MPTLICPTILKTRQSIEFQLYNMNDIKIIRDEIAPDGTRIVYAQTCPEVCSQQVAFAVKDGVLIEAAFAGGCSGNTQGICRLVAGMKVEEVISRLDGIRCGGKPTSCPDQLARALKATLQ